MQLFSAMAADGIADKLERPVDKRHAELYCVVALDVESGSLP
jgi:IMP cyclohydrolase